MGLFDIFKSGQKKPNDSMLLPDELVILPSQEDACYTIANFILPQIANKGYEKEKSIWNRTITKHSHKLCQFAYNLNGYTEIELPFEILLEQGRTQSGVREWLLVEYPVSSISMPLAPIFSVIVLDSATKTSIYHTLNHSIDGTTTHRIIQPDGTAYNLGAGSIPDPEKFLQSIFSNREWKAYASRNRNQKLSIHENISKSLIAEEARHGQKQRRIIEKTPSLYSLISSWLDSIDASNDEPIQRSTVSPELNATKECLKILNEVIHSAGEALESDELKEISILAYSSIRTAINSFQPDSDLSTPKICALFDSHTASEIFSAELDQKIDERSEIYFRLFHTYGMEIRRGEFGSFNQALGHKFSQFCLGGGGKNDPIILKDFLSDIPNQVYAVKIWWIGFENAKSILADWDGARN